MSYFSKSKTYWLLGIWVVTATAAGLYLTKVFLKPKDQDILAPMADVRECGPKNLADNQSSKTLSQWVTQVEGLSADAQSALARNLQALPDGATKALEQSRFKIALSRGDAPYTCVVYDQPPNKSKASAMPLMTAENCLRSTGKGDTTLVLGRPQLLNPDGTPRYLQDEDLVDESLLPTVFWALFEGLYQPSDLGSIKLDQEAASATNISSTIARHVVSAYNLTPEEKQYYLKAFGAAGTETPSFLRRTLALTAAAAYCSQESFARLQNQQPEVSRRFMSIYGCTLGKPWHLADDDFSKFCPNLASTK